MNWRKLISVMLLLLAGSAGMEAQRRPWAIGQQRGNAPGPGRGEGRGNAPGPWAGQNRRNDDRQERRHGGDWLRQHSNQPVEQQMRELENDPNFKRLPPERQQRLREWLQRFNSLPPEQRQRTIQRMDAWEHMSPEQKQRARDMFARLRAIPPERRQALRQAFESLRGLSPAERERALNSPELRDNFSDQERDLLRGMNELNLGSGRGPQ